MPKDITLLPRELEIKRPPWLHDFVLPWRICAQRILVVTDGGLDYNETNGFGLTQFLLALETSAPFGLAPVIHIAHRTDNTNLASATMKAKFSFHKGFVFENSNAAHALMRGSTRRFDQLWVFGAGGGAISDDEVRVIAAFMAARGGVFATGDHQTLGQGISGRLPRVRKMREWSAVPATGMTRIDTVNQPSPDGTWLFNSQSDTIAQRIFPHFKPVGADFLPHALLRYGAGSDFQTNVVDVLPDHPHESECYAGSGLGNPYDGGVTGIDPVEFPALAGSAVPFSPEVVATSISGGRILEKKPVTPRCFGAISAYDGHRVARGRVVCDATWHHFVNINLDGTGVSGTNAATRKGLFTSPGVPSPEYEKIKQYYRNIAQWVGPVRLCWWYLTLAIERFQYPLFEEIVVLPKVPPPWPELVELGSQIQAALDAGGGRGFTGDMVRELLADNPQALVLAGLGDALRADSPPLSLVNSDEFVRGMAGAIGLGVFAGLPESPWQARKVFEKNKDLDGLAERAITQSLKRGLAAASKHYTEAARQTLELVKEALV